MIQFSIYHAPFLKIKIIVNRRINQGQSVKVRNTDVVFLYVLPVIINTISIYNQWFYVCSYFYHNIYLFILRSRVTVTHMQFTVPTYTDYNL